MSAGRVLVTGGGSGIGAAACELLARYGWDPVAADIRRPGEGVTLDVTDEAQWDAVLDHVGVLAGLVNCAGIRTRGMIVDTDLATWQRHLEVNVTGSWLGIRGLFRRHREGSAAAVVNIASVNTDIVVPGQAHYAASKGAVMSLTKAAAIEGAPLGIRVNAIGPGPIRTPMTAERLADPAQVAWLEGRVPLRRFGEPEEIAEVVQFLLSPAASYITGQLLFVDGGWIANGA